MKRCYTFFSFFLCTISSFAAETPSLNQVLVHYFEHYRYEPNRQGYLCFAKKKDGWHVFEKDYTDNREFNDALFWSAEKDRYMPLSHTYNTERADMNDIETMPDYQRILANYFQYERCVYYGYNQWSWDVINDYSEKADKTDLEMESLARAYAAYAIGFLWFTDIYNANTGNLHRIKLPEEKEPDNTRIDSFLFYDRKAQDIYLQLSKRNPHYQTVVGSIYNKYCNETMFAWSMLQMCKKPEMAREFLLKSAMDSGMLAYAHNYLYQLKPNAILLTNGDNDTYPLWYLQQTRGYRRDVSVINYSLLEYGPFTRLFETGTITNVLKTGYMEKYRSMPGFYYATADYSDSAGLKPLSQLMYSIRKSGDNDENVLPHYVFNAGNYALTESGNIRFKTDNYYITLRDLLLYDLIDYNSPSRPVYLVDDLLHEKKELAPYTSIQGLSALIVNYNTEVQPEDIPAIRNFINTMLPIYNNKSIDLKQDYTTQIFMGKYRQLIYTLMLNTYASGDTLSILADKCMSLFPGKDFYYTSELAPMASLLYDQGFKSKAEQIAKALLLHIEKDYADNTERLKHQDNFTALINSEHYDYDLFVLRECYERNNMKKELEALDTLKKKLGVE